MRRTIPQEEISILNIYAPSTGRPIYIKKKFSMALRAQIGTVIVGELNTPLSPTDRFHPDKREINFRTTTHIKPNRHG
jgi:hypothetical protein